jgi:hypothetical protein
MPGKHVITARMNTLDGQTLKEEDLQTAGEHFDGSAIFLETKLDQPEVNGGCKSYQRSAVEMMTGYLKDIQE